MERTHIFKVESDKSLSELVNEIKVKGTELGFIIKEDFDLGELFKSHNINADKNFKFHSIQLCIPQKAYNSINENPERVSLIIPKNIIIYNNEEINKRIITYLFIGSDFLKQILPEDKKIQNSIPESSNKIIKLINSIK